MNFGDGPKGNKFAHAGIGENNVDSGGEAVYTPTDVKKRGDLISARTSRSTVSRGLQEPQGLAQQ